MADKVLTDKLEARVTEALVSFGADPEAIRREAEFEELEIDSLDLVELAQIVEEEYGVAITSEDAQELKTVGDALDMITSRLP